MKRKFHLGMQNNINSVVEFQRWWVLKSKLFAQKSTCSKEILISTSLKHLWFLVDGVIKVDYLDFSWEKMEILCELDVGVIACNFLVFGIFRIFSDFFRFFSLKLIYFWTKSRKNIYGSFLYSICATELKFGTQNNVRVRQSILKTLIFANYWKS